MSFHNLRQGQAEMTRADFERQSYRQSEGITSPAQSYQSFLKEWQAVECRCGEAECPGWRLVRKETPPFVPEDQA